jgi:site-specific DNA-cytosine methylase
MNVLVACEFSGIIRDAFRARGHDAWSCDIIDTEVTGPHIKADVLDILYHSYDSYPDWDLMIAHPPCDDLAVSGARWFPQKIANGSQQRSIQFFMRLVNAPNIERICVENPISIMSTRYRKPDQIIQPWMFGHGETKATCLWLKNLPLLQPTHVVGGREQRVWKEGPSPERKKNRSRTYTGVAQAMAEQWG